MAVKEKRIEIEHDFQGGVTLSSSGVKNGLIAAVALGLLDKSCATEVLFLIREATEHLLQTMAD